jgi:TatA/E family protein of Tat protein translocase
MPKKNNQSGLMCLLYYKFAHNLLTMSTHLSFVLLFGISGGEIMIIFLLVLLLFGPKKIPEIARAIGKGMNEIKKVQRDINSEINRYAHEIENPAKQINEDIQGFKKGLNDQVSQTLGDTGEKIIAEEQAVTDEEYELPFPYNMAGNPAVDYDKDENKNESDTVK